MVLIIMFYLFLSLIYLSFYLFIYSSNHLFILSSNYLTFKVTMANTASIMLTTMKRCTIFDS